MVLPGAEDFRGFLANAVHAHEPVFGGAEDGCWVPKGFEEAANSDGTDFRKQVEGDDGFLGGHGGGFEI